MAESDLPPVRLAEIVASLSLGIDLGFGQPMEHVLRQCLIASRMADALGVDEQNRIAVYYTALLINIGCHTDAHEQAKWFGDDIACKAIKYRHEPRSLRMAASGLGLVGAGLPPFHRMRLGLEFMFSGRRELENMITQHAKLARLLGEQLELPLLALDAIGAAYERWDGRGWPGKLARGEIPVAARIASAAEYIEVAHRIGGVGAAKKLAREWRGGQFDPDISSLLLERREALFADLGTLHVWETVLAAEPALAVTLSGDRLDAALAAIASFVDLKSPYFLGHSKAVAELAAEAAARLGMTAPEIRLVRRAGLLHGLGRLGISNAIWDKRGPLGVGEWERVRLQPYLTERMLRQSTTLEPIARVAAQHRERADGSGYPRGLAGTAIGREARILAGADAYQALREPRPHRPARSDADAAAVMRDEVRAGRFDADAVEAVLGAAGHRVLRRREGPAGLTSREIEVLRLVARGFSNKEIASALFIAAKTAANHVEHIYAKIDAPNRAAASLFAVQHGLLPDEEFPARPSS